jgi:putative ABC transport system ATP-binding protein
LASPISPPRRPRLVARALARVYAADGVEVHALQGLDLTINAGDFVAVMGPSGCGKSTLLHLLGGLDASDGGEVVLDGQSLAGLDDRAITEVRRHRVGMVFQFFNLVPVLTAAENIALPAVIDGADRTERNARVGELLRLVGLEPVADKLPSQLSGGQQQRVAIARALVNDPAVVLADEPTGNLDLRSGMEIMDLFGALHASGHTIVIVTHDPNIARFAERIVFMQDGRLVDELTLTPTVDASTIAARLVDLDPPQVR